ncbi:MAG: phage major capsid protein [Luminiphilus sp.]
MDLPIKDLQALRQQYVEQREDVKKAAELEDRDLNDADVAEMERLATEIRKVDVQLKVKREDQAIAKSAVLAGESSRGEENELRGMSKRFDLAGAVRDLAQGKRVTGVAAEFTDEAIREARGTNMNLKGQLSIPSKVLRAVGDAGEFGAGSTLTNSPGFVPTNVTAGIAALAAPTKFEAMGGRVLNGLTGNVSVPIVTAASTISEPSEGAAVAADANTAIGARTLSPNRYSAFVTVTEQLMLQGGPAVEQLITQDMVTQLNRQIDKTVFDTIIGTGDGDNTNAVSAAEMLNGEAALAAAGVDLANVQVIANSVAHALLASDDIVTSVSAAIDRQTAGNFNALGYPYHVTDLLPDNGVAADGSLIMGDFNMAAVLGMFGGLDIVINPYTLDINHQVRISVHRYADAAVLHADAAYTFHDNA